MVFPGCIEWYPRRSAPVPFSGYPRSLVWVEIVQTGLWKPRAGWPSSADAVFSARQKRVAWAYFLIRKRRHAEVIGCSPEAISSRGIKRYNVTKLLNFCCRTVMEVPGKSALLRLRQDAISTSLKENVHYRSTPEDRVWKTPLTGGPVAFGSRNERAVHFFPTDCKKSVDSCPGWI